MLQEKVFVLIAAYGYIGIFLSLVLGIIGLPIPDEVLLTFAGFLAATGRMNYFLLILVSIIGSIIGVSMSYWIGSSFGIPFIKKYGKYIHVTEETLKKSEKWYDRYGKYAIIIGYFFPGIRQLNAYYAGISKRPFGEFSLYAFLGGTLWVMSFITLGMYVNENWRTFCGYFHRISFVAIVIFIIAILIFIKRKKRK